VILSTAAALVLAALTEGSAIQTDWSGGPGVQGPTTEWGDSFHLDTAVNWYAAPGALTLYSGTLGHTVESDIWDVRDVHAEDIDGDGDIDITGASSGGGEIAWWENVDCIGTVWTRHAIDDEYPGAYTIYPADVNGDGFMDVIGAAAVGNQLVCWWRNIDGSGTSWWKHFVGCDSVHSVCGEDIDSDGHVDILAADYGEGRIIWWENPDGAYRSWEIHVVDDDFYAPWSVRAGDIDGDGCMDVVGSSMIGDIVAWWENLDGSGVFWEEHLVDMAFDGACCVATADVDSDGDLDILGAGYYEDSYVWWENADGSGMVWAEHLIAGSCSGARWVDAGDLDGDGDKDVAGAAIMADDITWWENCDGSGGSWAEHPLDESFGGACCVHVGDIDGNGQMDVLGSAWSQGDIVWWGLDSYQAEGMLESSILQLPEDPVWGELNWDCSQPPGTQVSLQVRSSEDPLDMGPWSGKITEECLLDSLLEEGTGYFQYRAVLESSDPDTAPWLYEVEVGWSPTGIVGERGLPQSLLLPFRPNPTSAPVIRLRIGEPTTVSLSLFDASGRMVYSRPAMEYAAGSHEIRVDGLPSGVYFCRSVAEGKTSARGFVVIERQH